MVRHNLKNFDIWRRRIYVAEPSPERYTARRTETVECMHQQMH